MRQESSDNQSRWFIKEIKRLTEKRDAAYEEVQKCDELIAAFTIICKEYNSKIETFEIEKPLNTRQKLVMYFCDRGNQGATLAQLQKYTKSSRGTVSGILYEKHKPWFVSETHSQGVLWRLTEEKYKYYSERVKNNRQF